MLTFNSQDLFLNRNIDRIIIIKVKILSAREFNVMLAPHFNNDSAQNLVSDSDAFSVI